MVAAALALVDLIVVPSLQNKLVHAKIAQLRDAAPAVAAQYETAAIDPAPVLQAASESAGVAEIAGTGSRSGVSSGKIKLISRDFQVDDKVLADFTAYLDSRKLRHSAEDIAANREAISRLLLEEVLRQVYGEGEVRRRTMAWDPQVQKALSLVPKAEELLKEPQRFIAEYEAEAKAAASRPQ